MQAPASDTRRRPRHRRRQLAPAKHTRSAAPRAEPPAAPPIASPAAPLVQLPGVPLGVLPAVPLGVLPAGPQPSVCPHKRQARAAPTQRALQALPKAHAGAGAAQTSTPPAPPPRGGTPRRAEAAAPLSPRARRLHRPPPRSHSLHGLPRNGHPAVADAAVAAAAPPARTPHGAPWCTQPSRSRARRRRSRHASRSATAPAASAPHPVRRHTPAAQRCPELLGTAAAAALPSRQQPRSRPRRREAPASSYLRPRQSMCAPASVQVRKCGVGWAQLFGKEHTGLQIEGPIPQRICALRRM
eukprot:365695-Chlamydomonas_euryale.AAC.2